MGRDSLTATEAAFKLGELLASGERLTDDEAGQVVAGCDSDPVAWEEMDSKARGNYRERAKRILRAASRIGCVYDCAMQDGKGKVVRIWQTVKLSEADFPQN